MQRGSKTERGKESRSAILDAALAEFTTKGYRGSSVNAIAQRAGITKSGLLHHFESKDALLAAVLAERRAPARGPEPREPSRDFLTALRDVVAHNQQDASWIRFFMIMVVESFTDEHPALPVTRARYEAVTDDLVELFRECYPSVTEEEARQFSTLSIAVLDGLQILRLLDEDFDMTVVFALHERAVESLLRANGH